MVEIKIDTKTLPKVGQKVNWQTQEDKDNNVWKTGNYLCDLFCYNYQGIFSFSQDKPRFVIHWECLDNSEAEFPEEQETITLYTEEDLFRAVIHLAKTIDTSSIPEDKIEKEVETFISEMNLKGKEFICVPSAHVEDCHIEDGRYEEIFLPKEYFKGFW